MKSTFANAVVRTLLLGYLISVFLFLWAPYRFTKPIFFGNGATWQEAAVVFSEPGLVRSVEPASPLVEAFTGEDTFGVELVVRSFSDRQRGDLPRILTISDGSGNDSAYNLVVGQRRDDLVVRIRTDREVLRDLRSAADEFRGVGIQVPWRNSLRRELGRDREHPRIAIDDFFSGGEARRITITYDGRELQISGDGRPYFSADVGDDLLRNWDPEYFVYLGNEGGAITRGSDRSKGFASLTHVVRDPISLRRQVPVSPPASSATVLPVRLENSGFSETSRSYAFPLVPPIRRPCTLNL